MSSKEQTIHTAVANQINAAFSMLLDVITRCDDQHWHSTDGDYPFSQVVFHTLFFSDFYSSESKDEFFSQSFHKAHRDFFDDYEELEYRIPVKTYDKDMIIEYFHFCRDKLERFVEQVNGDSLMHVSPLTRSKLPRIELLVFTARHIQHHAAQLGLRIQLRTGVEMPWKSSGFAVL